jgi:hypothetical protein
MNRDKSSNMLSRRGANRLHPITTTPFGKRFIKRDMSTYHRLSLRVKLLYSGLAVLWHDSLQRVCDSDYKGVRQPRNGIVAFVRQNHETLREDLESSSSSSGSIGCYLRCCLTCSRLWFSFVKELKYFMLRRAVRVVVMTNSGCPTNHCGRSNCLATLITLNQASKKKKTSERRIRR